MTSENIQNWVFPHFGPASLDEIEDKISEKELVYTIYKKDSQNIEYLFISKSRLRIEIDRINTSNPYSIEPNIVILNVFNKDTILHLMNLIEEYHLKNQQ